MGTWIGVGVIETVVEVCRGEGVHVGSVVCAGDNMCVVGICVDAVCVCVNGSIARAGDNVCDVAMCGDIVCVCVNGSIVRAGDNVCDVAMCGDIVCVCVNGSIVRAGDNVCDVAMCACTMCVCVNACVGEGRVGELHVGGVCVVCAVYGAIVMCMGVRCTMRVGEVCAGDACVCFIFISRCSVLSTFRNRGISFCPRYLIGSSLLCYKNRSFNIVVALLHM